MRVAPLISTFFASVALVGGGLAVDASAAAKTVKPKADAPKTRAETAEPRPAAHGLMGLLHADPDRVRARLGEPAIARAEGRGAFWTYRAPRCALYIFFKDEGSGLKVSGAAAGPRRRGAPYSDLDACLADLQQSQGAS